MQLFKGRYIALMCMFFMLSFNVPSYAKVIAIIICAAIAAIMLISSFFLPKKGEVTVILIMLCCIVFLGGLLRSYFSIDVKHERALEYEGYKNIEMTVISDEGENVRGSELIVNITRIGEEKTDFRSLAITAFSAELHSGDRLSARVRLMDPSDKLWGLNAYERVNDEKICLMAVIYDAENISVNECGNTYSWWELLLGDSGGEIIVNKVRDFIGTEFDDALGKDLSPLAKGFFMNETSDISADVVRDFRRCGLSHLMAVSGMHITILLGAIDKILTYLLVDKKVRCVIISLLSFGLLIITGFSSSASRSVIMLWITYIHFFMADDEDAVTSLFLAVFIILLISPYSYYDLGLWMSFLATLGLITVYSFIDEKIPKLHKKKRISYIFKRMLRGAVTVLLMTLVANLFVLPFSWKIFGQISIAAIPANLILSPISTIFLAEIPIVFLLSKIPYIGGFALSVMRVTEEVMLKVMRIFSKWDMAVQPLNYVFADIIIFMLLVLVAVFLVIKLKNKLIMIIPPIAAVIAFSVCIAVTYLQQPALATFVADGDEQMIVVTDDGKTVLFDVSEGSADLYYEGYGKACEYGGSKIDALIYTNLHNEQANILSYLGASTVVDEIWLPKPQNDGERNIVSEIFSVAEIIEAKVYVYDENTFFDTERGISVYIERGTNGKTALLSIYKGETELNFFDPNVLEEEISIEKVLNNGNYAIISAGFDSSNTSKIVLNGDKLESFVFASEKAYNANAVKCGEIPIYINREKYKVWDISFFLK